MRLFSDNYVFTENTILKNRVNDIWNDFHKDLYKYILSRVNDADSAKDILQESFIKIHQNILSLKDEKSLKFWLYRIVKNSIMDYFRSRKYTSGIYDQDISDNEVQDRTFDLSRCVIPFINNLPEKYKEALNLTEFQKYSQIELAEHLGISYSGAKSRVQRAKHKLKELFEECCEISSDKYGNIIDYRSRCCKPGVTGAKCRS